MFPEQLNARIAHQLSDMLEKNVVITHSRPVGGGDINQAFRLQTTAGDYFVKYNARTAYPEMFLKEAKGLELLRSANEIRIPEVVCTGNSAAYSYLVLEMIESSLRSLNFWKDFGHSLARMHKQTNHFHGLDHANYIGSLAQSNTKHKTWSAFFVEERLRPKTEQAFNEGKISLGTLRKFENLYKNLDELFPVEPPSLLHGDLWSGNFMVDERGYACLIDPAVYYGHREMDIAMTKLFGGFEHSFYTHYVEEYPLERGWEDRMQLCNLYPLLVHVILFGGSYVYQVEQILHAF